MVSARVPGAVRENKALDVMSEDGNSRVLCGEPYDNWSNVTVRVPKDMLVDPGGSAPVLRLPMPPIPGYVYPVGIIREERQNCVRVMFVPGIAKISDDLANGLLIVVNSRSRNLPES